MQKESFIFYRSFYEAFSPLNTDQKAELMTAICEYALNQKETENDPIVSAMFSLIKPQLQANYKKYQNGRKGGRPLSNEEPKHNLTETKHKPKHNLTETKHKPNVNENVNENVNVNVIDKSIKKKIPKNKLDYLPDWLDLDIWGDFIKMRKSIKKPMTERAEKLILSKLGKLKTDPNKSLEQSIINSWQDVYEVKNENGNNANYRTNKNRIDGTSGGSRSIDYYVQEATEKLIEENRRKNTNKDL